MKHIFKSVVQPFVPDVIFNRQDKMGFPTPLTEWIKGDAHDFVHDVFSSHNALNRELINNSKVVDGLAKESQFGRKIWGLLCLELWQQEFHDKENDYKELVDLSKEGVLK